MMRALILAALLFSAPLRGQEQALPVLLQQSEALLAKKAYAEAAQLMRQAVQIAEREDTQALRNGGLNFLLAKILYLNGDYREAERSYERALQLHALLLPELDLAHHYVALGLNKQALGKFEEAESWQQRAIEIRQRLLSADAYLIAEARNNRALSLHALGRHDEATEEYRAAITIIERGVGNDHPIMQKVVGNLADTLAAKGRREEAESLYLRAIKAQEFHLPEMHPDLAVTRHNLAILYQGSGRIEDSQELFAKARQALEQLHGPRHPRVAEVMLSQSASLSFARRFDEARELRAKALQILQTTLLGFHVTTLSARLLEALDDAQQGRWQHAADTVRVVLMIARAELGDSHMLTITAAYMHAAIQTMIGNASEALAVTDASYRHVATLLARQSRFPSGASDEAARYHWLFDFFISSLLASGRTQAAEQAFEAAQLSRISQVGQTLVQTTLRLAEGNTPLATKLREQQSLSEEIQRLERDLMQAIAQAQDSRPPAHRTQAESIAQKHARWRQLDEEIARGHPNFQILTGASVASLRETQQLLGADEALLMYRVLRSGVYAWAVRADAVQFIRLPISEHELNDRVASLRFLLDPRLNLERKPFDVDAAHALYQKLFAPLDTTLSGAKHIVVVPDGSLQSLPFAVLVSAPSSSGEASRWLADKYAFTTIPSVASLQAFRQNPASARPGKQFIGFGAPELQGNKSQVSPKNSGVGGLERGIANVAEIAGAAPLPETREELQGLARLLGAPQNRVLLGKNATESQVKKTRLDQFDIIAFSTHAFDAGALSGMAEPGLILTPPPVGSREDDGFLSASEIAQLKMKADWVLLAACSTANPARGQEEYLSGLARSFFHAGARTLLASYWNVDSAATVVLVTRMMQHYMQSGMTQKAESLRIAGAALRQNPRFQHPMYWAPFVVVGDGR